MRFKNYTNLFYAFLVVAGTMGFSGCSKDEEKDQTPTGTSSSLATAKIGTNNFVSSQVITSTEFFEGLTFIEISYINKSADTLTINIKGGARTGEKLANEVNGNDTEFNFGLNYTKVDGTDYTLSDGNKGEMTITSHDKTAKIIKGTFSGSLTSFDFNNDLLNVTKGKFEAKY